MLAFAWSWDASSDFALRGLSQRLAASLCSGIGGSAGAVDLEGIQLAYRPLGGTAAQARAWRPARLDSGALVAFHGYIDNPAELSAELGAGPGDLAQLYGRAVERWGSEADRRVIGEYCAIVAYPDRRTVRLARSPLRAPPLVYHHDAAGVAGIGPASFVRRRSARAAEPRPCRGQRMDQLHRARG